MKFTYSLQYRLFSKVTYLQQQIYYKNCILSTPQHVLTQVISPLHHNFFTIEVNYSNQQMFFFIKAETNTGIGNEV